MGKGTGGMAARMSCLSMVLLPYQKVANTVRRKLLDWASRFDRPSFTENKTNGCDKYQIQKAIETPSSIRPYSTAMLLGS